MSCSEDRLMVNRVFLQSLIGSHPLGALSAFGLLRLAASWDPSAKLGFALDDDWIAFLEAEELTSIDALIEKLTDWVQSDAIDRILGWAPDVRVTPQTYRQVITEAVAESDDTFARFLVAFAADGAVDAQKGLIKPSAFYMVSGQQSFLKGLGEIVAQGRLDAPAIFHEALVGPWSYKTSLHSLGWDPSTERLYALRHRAPTSEKPTCVAGAVLLALWALPIFPAVSEAGRVRTVGFTRDRRGSQHFSWPVFSCPVGLHELKSLLQTGDETWAYQSVLRPGIEAIYRARRSEFGQGYAVFRNSEVRSASKAVSMSSAETGI
jgi:hypothetical protein